MAFAQSHPPRAKYKLNGAQNGTHNGSDAKDEKVFVTTTVIGFSHFYLLSFFAGNKSIRLFSKYVSLYSGTSEYDHPWDQEIWP